MSNTDFNNVAARDAAQTTNGFFKAVIAERPDLAKEANVTFGSGMCGHVILFNDEVFKMPKLAADMPKFEQEIKVHQQLQGSGVAVPAITTVEKDNQFFGMERVRGVLLYPEFLASMSTAEQQGVAEDIAKFLHGLASAFTPSEMKQTFTAFTGGLPSPGEIMVGLKSPHLQDILGDKLAAASDMMDQHLARQKDVKRVAVYEDFHCANILCSPETGRVSHVIDFGYVCASLPESSFIALRFHYGAAFTTMVCDEFSKLADEKVSYRDVLLCHLAYNITTCRDMRQTIARFLKRPKLIRSRL